MPRYDFETPLPMQRTASTKWDAARRLGMQEGITPFTVADMELRSAPEIVEAVSEAAATGIWGYTWADSGFCSDVAGWMQRRHGWLAQPQWLVATPGVVPAVYSAVRAFTKPGDGVLVQSPVYMPFFSIIRENDRRVVENRLLYRDGAYTMDFAALAEQLREARLMILCSPHNPVGRVWTEEELLQVLQLCRENGVVLFADEIHCDLILGEREFVSAGRLLPQAPQALLIGTAASKTFSLAGLATSSVFIPDGETRARYKKQLHADGIEFNSTFGVVATRAAYTKAEPWLDALLEHLRGNARLIQEYVAGLNGVCMPEVEATYLAWLDFTALGLAEEELDTLLRGAGLYLNDGPAFGGGGEGFRRLNFACPRAVLQAALERLGAALASLDA